MREHDFIDTPQYEAAVAEKVALHDNLRRDDPVGMHFKEVVRRELVERFGKEAVYQGRLKVYTTIDPDMQKAAEDALTSSLGEIEARLTKARRRASPGCSARARSRNRRSTGHRRWPRHSRRRSQSRFADETSARVCVQTVRLRGRAREWIRAGNGDRSAQYSGRHLSGQVAARGRTLDCGIHDDSHRAPHVEQPRCGSDAGDRRSRPHGLLRRAPRRWNGAQCAVTRPWVRRDDAGVDDLRVCGIRPWRRRQRACLHQASGRSGWDDLVRGRFETAAGGFGDDSFHDGDDAGRRD